MVGSCCAGASQLTSKPLGPVGQCEKDVLVKVLADTAKASSRVRGQDLRGRWFCVAAARPGSLCQWRRIGQGKFRDAERLRATSQRQRRRRNDTFFYEFFLAMHHKPECISMYQTMITSISNHSQMSECRELSFAMPARLLLPFATSDPQPTPGRLPHGKSRGGFVMST